MIRLEQGFFEINKGNYVTPNEQLQYNIWLALMEISSALAAKAFGSAEIKPAASKEAKPLSTAPKPTATRKPRASTTKTKTVKKK
jgi:hypothetical protein